MVKIAFLSCLLFIFSWSDGFAFSGSNPSANLYDQEALVSSGVSMKDGMYYCEPLASYITPYRSKPDVEQCAYASEAQKICSSSPNTRWISGRCFCQEQNKYLQPRVRTHSKRIKLNDSDALSHLFTLTSLVNKCPSFQAREKPFGRSVVLSPVDDSFVIEQPDTKTPWDNRDDFPGEQGSPHLPAKIATALEIPIGFGYIVGYFPVLPKFDTLTHNLNQISSDVSFFEVNGELSGRKYLEEFIQNLLPIARIEDTGDATYFLHDLNFHVMGFLLLPSEIRELAQKQTYYLLDFIDTFSTHYPKEWDKPEFKFLMQTLITHQVSRIDIWTGNLTQHLNHLLKKHTSLSSFLNSLPRLKPSEKSELNFHLMAITDGRHELSEKKSVKDFLSNPLLKVLALSTFEKEDFASKDLFLKVLSDYIKSKESVPDFVNEIEIDTGRDVLAGNPGKFGISSIDLFVKRLRWLKERGKK